MDVLITALGAFLIIAVLRDIFGTLFDPHGHGVLGSLIARGVWAAAHKLHSRGSRQPLYAGALAYILVLASWTALLVVGWALVYWPHLPESFVFAQGLNPNEHASFLDALYLSLVNLTSLGYGDIAPEGTLLRLLGPIETLFGLGLLTASISWLVSIYNALGRRETLVHEVSLLREAEQRLGENLAALEPQMLERLLGSINEQTIAVRRDLIHLPITHFFQSAEERQARAELRGFLRELIEQAQDDTRPAALRLQADMLSQALDDFEQTLEKQF